MQEMTITSVHALGPRYAVILKEKDADRYLPILVGASDANAIAIKLHNPQVSLNLTHDLLCTVIDALGGSVRQVLINRDCPDQKERCCLRSSTIGGRGPFCPPGYVRRSEDRLCESFVLTLGVPKALLFYQQRSSGTHRTRRTEVTTTPHVASVPAAQCPPVLTLDVYGVARSMSRPFHYVHSLPCQHRFGVEGTTLVSTPPVARAATGPGVGAIPRRCHSLSPPASSLSCLCSLRDHNYRKIAR